MDKYGQGSKSCSCGDIMATESIETQIEHMMKCHGMKDRGEALDAAIEHFKGKFEVWFTNRSAN